MTTAVFTWRCKCGARIKVIGETEKASPSAKVVAACPQCGNKQLISAIRIVSVVIEPEESGRAGRSL